MKKADDDDDAMNSGPMMIFFLVLRLLETWIDDWIEAIEITISRVVDSVEDVLPATRHPPMHKRRAGRQLKSLAARIVAQIMVAAIVLPSSYCSLLILIILVGSLLVVISRGLVEA
jgi:hypothetical protein